MYRRLTKVSIIFVIIPDGVDYVFKKNIRVVGLKNFINIYLPKITLKKFKIEFEIFKVDNFY